MIERLYQEFIEDFEHCTGRQVADTSFSDHSSGIHVMLLQSRALRSPDLVGRPEPKTAMGRVAVASALISSVDYYAESNAVCPMVEPHILRTVDRMATDTLGMRGRGGIIFVGEGGQPVAIRKTCGVDMIFTVRPTRRLLSGVLVPAGFAMQTDFGGEESRSALVGRLPTAPNRQHVKVAHLTASPDSEQPTREEVSTHGWNTILARATVFAVDGVTDYEVVEECRLPDIPSQFDASIIDAIRDKIDDLLAGGDVEPFTNVLPRT